MRLLVTGGSGFLGSTLVGLAVAQGHVVAVLSRERRPDATAKISTIIGSMEQIPWEEVRAFAPEACVHAAWIATPGIYLESAENHDWVRWSSDFLSGLPAQGVRSIVALGTCIEYRITGKPLAEETTPLEPASTYARCKHELHGQLRSLLRDSAASFAWARIFYPYGPGEHPARLISSLITRLRAGERVTLRTPHSIKDYVHVEDVAAALLLLAEQSFDDAINVGTGEGVAVETIARCLAESLHRPDLISAAEVAVADPLDYVVADSTRLRSLGWKPRHLLHDGLRRMTGASRS